MKTKSIHFAALQIGEAFSFSRQVAALFRSSANLTPKLAELVERLEATIAVLERVLARAAYIVEIKNKRAMDSKRDSEYLCFKSLAEAFVHSTNPAVNEAANLVYRALKDAGSVQRLKLDKESSALYGLNSLFTTNERYVAALKALSATAQWEVVMAAQAEYEEDSRLLSEVKVKEAEPVSAYTLAKVACRQCAALFEMLNALNLVDPRPEYDGLVAHLNREIDTLRQQVRARQTLAAKAKKKHGEDGAGKKDVL
ncbi:DUF6261 family protein [uncultured Acetobacteroides sp.]|uniref:DUF6261 family protein n=1 Tax=uncultured Acetobacteroides sp. TaxID=1760811 RepID=UPI0029F47DB0|nr:DUF6261 family protein [uncultured Acetobacteroides sp.]